jgi:hypothetical protein
MIAGELLTEPRNRIYLDASSLHFYTICTNPFEIELSTIPTEQVGSTVAMTYY